MARILVVDDDATFLRLLELMLRRENHIITIARSEHEALNYLDQAPVDTLLVDIFMPKMDGFSFLTKLRADGQYQHLPVSILTASDWRHIANQAYENGANRFLLKPFSSWELKRTVADCLGIS